MDPAAPPPGQPSTPPAGPPVPGAVRLGSAFGVSIYLRWSWLFLAVALVYLYGPVEQRRVPGLSQPGAYGLAFAFVAFLLLSVLLHELGHALTARGFGIGVKAITLDLLGGYTEMEGDSPRPSADFFVSAVGPAVSAVLGVAAWGCAAGPARPHGHRRARLPARLAATCWWRLQRAAGPAAGRWPGAAGRWSGASPATATPAPRSPAGSGARWRF